MSDECISLKDLATGVYVHIYDRIGVVNGIKKLVGHLFYTVQNLMLVQELT